MKNCKTAVRVPALGLTLVCGCLLAIPAHAGRGATKQESAAIATGFAVGAVAGGPVGAIAGAAAGGWLAERHGRQVQARDSLTADLQRSEAERARLAREVADRGGSLMRALDHTRDLETEVLFRTGDASLTEQAAARLAQIGALAGALPDARLRVSGYADPRGPEESNVALSQRRAEVVAAALTAGGMPAERLDLEARGEASATTADGDLDGYAFDRRATVRIVRTAGGSLARAE